jgi:hypothetical protein
MAGSVVTGTVCIRCQHVVEYTRRMPPYRWLCEKHRRGGDGFGFVTDTDWDDKPPYLFCKDVNGGFCPLFEPLEDT